MHRQWPWCLQLRDGTPGPRPHKLPLAVAALKYQIGEPGGFQLGVAVVADQQPAVKDQRRLLLTIDEYENFDQKIGEKAFSTDLLALIRESIQTHRQIVWVFAGSHHVSELRYAPWSSYLISVRTVEVPLFSLDETRRLPLTYSRLWQRDDPERPRIEAGLWG